MQILKKLKKFIPNKKKLKKTILLILTPLALLFFFLLIRGCSSPHLKIKSVYLIGRESTWQFDLLGRDRNLTGFTNDLIAYIAAENKLRFQWVETNASHLLDGLENHSYDFILSAMRPTILNHDHYDLSELIFDLGPVLIVREDSQITSLKEMGTKPIGVSYGASTNFNSLRTPGVNIYDMSLVYYNNINRALDDLSNDTIDGVIMQTVPAYAITQGLYAGKLKVVTAPFTDEGLRIVSLKNDALEEIINVINESINKMRQDGTYVQLINKWNLVDPQSQFWHLPE